MRLNNFLTEKAKIIKIYKNKEDGVEAHVAKVEKGFSVSLKDTDSGEFLDTFFIYPDEKKAHKKAKQMVEEKLLTEEPKDFIKSGKEMETAIINALNKVYQNNDYFNEFYKSKMKDFDRMIKAAAINGADEFIKKMRRETK